MPKSQDRARLRAVEELPSSRRKEVITIHARPHPLELASQRYDASSLALARLLNGV